jgi:hypothetical protein
LDDGGAAHSNETSVVAMYNPAYREQNAGALRQDWPRVPLPSAQDALLASAALGRQVAALLDSEQAVAGISVGAPRPELRTIGAMARRIAALLLAPMLDGNYRAVKAATIDWSNSAAVKKS